MKLPELVLLVRTERRFSSLLRVGMDVVQRKLTIDDPDFVFVVLFDLLERRVKTAAVRAFEVREFHDGDGRLLRSSRRMALGGHGRAIGLHHRLKTVILAQLRKQGGKSAFLVLLHEVIANLERRLDKRSIDHGFVVVIELTHSLIGRNDHVALDFLPYQVINRDVAFLCFGSQQLLVHDFLESIGDGLFLVPFEGHHELLALLLKLFELRVGSFLKLFFGDRLAIHGGHYLGLVLRACHA